ncbi:thermonuclease family protein [Salmonella enterica subsp. enterica serovar Newport]|nr:thermonuclease family protein [Salmonella enterica subsp. enterica serovar Newport]
MSYRIRLLGALALLFPALCLADFSGRIVRVIDGDTVQVLSDSKMMKVRLSGIDAPESGQPFGQRSKQNLLNLAAQKQVNVIADTTDRYGRWLGTLMIDGLNINAEQIKAGMAWAYRYHGHASDKEMMELEDTARRHKIGLWSSSSPIEPWKWRRVNK